MTLEAYFPHDATASSNKKIIVLIQEEGAKGYGIYWLVLEFLRQQRDYTGDLAVLPTLARKFRISTATLRRIIYSYSLFDIHEETFSSPGLITRMKPWDDKRAMYKEAGRRGGLVTQKKMRDLKESVAQANTNQSIQIIPPSSPLKRGQEENRVENTKEEEILFSPPPYALCQDTHNYPGLMERLTQLRITSQEEIRTILKLSDYGRKGTPVWKVLASTRWEQITLPGRFLIKMIKEN